MYIYMYIKMHMYMFMYIYKYINIYENIPVIMNHQGHNHSWNGSVRKRDGETDAKKERERK